MSDDALIAGAAAPVGSRRIRSTVVLDAAWVIVTSTALLVSSRFALIDLPNQYLRTGDAQLRIWVVGLPTIALLIAVVSIIRRSGALAALATGIVSPGVALAGSLAVSLFLNDSSAFADAGVAVSLGASFVGVAMLLRWFVYHPADMLSDESRPHRGLSLAVTAVGIVTAAVVVVSGVIDDGSWSSSFAFQTALILVVPLVLAVCGLVRTRPTMALAAGAALAQIVGVIVVRTELLVPLDSDLVLRTGAPGIVLLMAAIVLSGIAFSRHSVDEPVDRIENDDADWRWTADD